MLLLGELLSLLLHKVLLYKDGNEWRILLYTKKKKRYIIPIKDLYNVCYVVFKDFFEGLIRKKNRKY